MKDLRLEMIEFTLDLPSSGNPYEAMIQKVKKESNMARPPFWGRIVRRIIAFQLLILCIQAIVVLWLRKRDGKLRFFRYNKLGLIHVELLNEVVLLMFIYSSCAVLDLVSQELVEKDLVRFSTKIILHTCKFSISAAVSWLFLWVLGIESAINLSSLGARARAGASIRLSLFKRFVINSTLIAVMTVPSVVVLWISIVTTFYLREAETISGQIISALAKRASTYQAESYSSLSLLEFLNPADSLISRSNDVAYSIKSLLLVYLVQHLVMSAFYIPTSTILLRSLRQQSHTGALLTSSGQNLIYDHSNSLAQVRKRLINQSFLFCLEHIMYLPPLMYLHFVIKGATFYSNSTWVLIEQVATHGPATIIGNIVLTYSIQNTWYTTRDTQNPRNTSTTQEKKPHYSECDMRHTDETNDFKQIDSMSTLHFEPQGSSLDISPWK